MKLIDGEIRILYSDIWSDLPRHIRDDGGIIVSFIGITHGKGDIALEREIQRRNKIAKIIAEALKRCDHKYKSGDHPYLQCSECGYIG